MATRFTCLNTPLLACLLLCSMGTQAAERIEEGSFPVDADARFHLNSNRATFKIRTADVNSIQITATIRHKDQDALDLVDISMSGSSSRVSVRVDRDSKYSNWNGSWFNWGNNGPHFPEVELDIVLPHTLSLDIDSHRSTMDIAVPSGKIHIDSHRSRGDITGIRSEFILDSHRDDLVLEVSQLHDMDINNHRSEMDMDILEGKDMDIRGKAHRGKFRFRGLDVDVEEERHESRVSYRTGTGANQVTLDSHRGDIRMDFRN